MAIPRQLHYAASAGLAVPIALLFLWRMLRAGFPELVEAGPQWLIYIQAAVWPSSVLLYDFERGVIWLRPGLATVAILLNSLLYLSVAAALYPALREYRALLAAIALMLSAGWWSLL